MESNKNKTNHTRANYSVTEAAEWMGVHYNTIRNLIDRGELGSSKAGAKIIISSLDLDEYYSKNRIGTNDEVESIVKDAKQKQA